MESSPLTPLENEIVRCVAQGFANELIARGLNLSVSGLQRELATIYEKLGIVSRVELLLSICSGQVNLGISRPVSDTRKKMAHPPSTGMAA